MTLLHRRLLLRLFSVGYVFLPQSPRGIERIAHVWLDQVHPLRVTQVRIPGSFHSWVVEEISKFGFEIRHLEDSHLMVPLILHLVTDTLRIVSETAILHQLHRYLFQIPPSLRKVIVHFKSGRALLLISHGEGVQMGEVKRLESIEL